MATILIVDDSPTERKTMEDILSKEGHTIIQATNGEDGVIMAKDTKPDMILMDVVMPGINGFQATRQLTKHDVTGHIPVVIVTTKDQETDKLWGKRQGASNYLTKPIDRKLLLKIVQQTLAETA